MGCAENEETVFFTDRNFEDQEVLFSVLNDLQTGINSRNITTLTRHIPPNFSIPDQQDPKIIHNYQRIRTGYLDFFDRTTDINYQFSDIFLKITENTARAELNCSRVFTGHSPFVYTVNDTQTERIFLRKEGDGKWVFTTLPSRLLPPVIADN
jgi:hypothetical protein